MTKKPVVKIQNFVRKHTQSVGLESFQQRGVTHVNCLTLSQLNDLISLAVLRIFEKYQRAFLESHAAQVQEEARLELLKNLSREKPTPEVLADSKRKLEEEVEALRPLVESRIAEVAEEKHRGQGPELAASCGDVLAEVESSVRSALERALHDGSRPDLAAFELELGEVVRRVLASARERLVRVVGAAAVQQTDVLERRLEKLKGHLAEMENALKALAAAREGDGGLPSVYREVQGLASGDPQFDKKKAMLQIIFEENMDLKKAGRT